MSTKYLGDQFDIHGGGVDLVFPHHENEIAQAQAAGKPFAQYWIHNGLLTIDGQKMSKSLGNFVTVDAAIERCGQRALKLFFVSVHYRSPIDYSAERIHDAKKMADRLEIAHKRLQDARETTAVASPNVARYVEQFQQAMDRDLNTPEALAALFELVAWVHKQADAGVPMPVEQVRASLVEMGQVFGLWAPDVADAGLAEHEIQQCIDARNAAKQRKDYAKADAIRAELLEKNVILEDAPHGTTWRRKR